VPAQPDSLVRTRGRHCKVPLDGFADHRHVLGGCQQLLDGSRRVGVCCCS
jgi:hypothetical protein